MVEAEDDADIVPLLVPVEDADALPDVLPVLVLLDVSVDVWVVTSHVRPDPSKMLLIAKLSVPTWSVQDEADAVSW